MLHDPRAHARRPHEARAQGRVPGRKPPNRADAGPRHSAHRTRPRRRGDRNEAAGPCASAPLRSLPRPAAFRTIGDAQQLASRRDHWALPAIAFRVKRSHPRLRRRPPADWGASSADAANPRDRFYTTGFGNASADPLVDGGMASLARTGSARGNGNARSPSPSPSRVISFWRQFLASPKSELIPLSSRINSAVNPLLIRCYGGRVSPVRAEFIAGSRRGERGFATISLPCGFCSSRGGRRSAMPSQFENPMMISLFENNNVCHDYFSHSERLRC